MNEHLTEEQTRRLREALRGHDIEAMLTLALVTGMRRDELLRLKWQNLDLVFPDRDGWPLRPEHLLRERWG